MLRQPFRCNDDCRITCFQHKLKAKLWISNMKLGIGRKSVWTSFILIKVCLSICNNRITLHISMKWFFSLNLLNLLVCTSQKLWHEVFWSFFVRLFEKLWHNMAGLCPFLNHFLQILLTLKMKKTLSLVQI